MNKHLTGLTLAAFSVVPALIAGESEADKPQGFRFFNQHLTIKPYVAISYSYDSNIDTTDKASGDSIFCIQPGADFEWKGDDRWSLVGSLWYRRNAYCKYANEMGENSFGESLAYKWTTSKQNEKGWSLTLAEKYRTSTSPTRSARATAAASGATARRLTSPASLNAALASVCMRMCARSTTGSTTRTIRASTRRCTAGSPIHLALKQVMRLLR